MASLASKIVQHLRTTVLRPEGAGLTDGQLLEGYLRQREETLFAALVRRHGPMVWGVCRRLVPNFHDAEDAFQATFLILVRKAESIRPREMVANWLYGVAYHTAQKARALAAKRATRERQVLTMPEPETLTQEREPDLEPHLDRELQRLPEKYRVPILLCDLEGKTYKEAARQLGCPEGTLAARLARARAMLAQRLTRQGLAVTGSALAAILTATRAEACVPTALMSSTIQAASLSAAGPAAASLVSTNVAALTEGVMHTMLLSKLKLTAAVALVIGIVGTGTGLLPSSKAGAVPLPATAALHQTQDQEDMDAAKRKKLIDLKKKMVEDDRKTDLQVDWWMKMDTLQQTVRDDAARKKMQEEARQKYALRKLAQDLDETIRKQEQQQQLELKIRRLRLELKLLEQVEEKQRMEQLMKELADALDRQKKETARMEKLMKELKDAMDRQKKSEQK
jgi:RNA polymerase sigma-70 factor (ECF subfamily)